MDKNKYIYLDLDGTLLNENKKVTKYSINTIKKLSKKYKFGIITGRPYCLVKEIIDSIKPQLPTITVNGGCATLNNKNLWFKTISTLEDKKIFNYLGKNKISFLMYAKDNLLYSQYIDWHWVSTLKKINAKSKEKYKFNFIEIKKMNEKIGKFFCNIENDEIMLEVKKYINSFANAYAITSQSKSLDIMPKNISKGWALKELEKLGYIDLNKTIVFGDNENDISMFVENCFSIAMKNGVDSLKLNADDVTQFDNNENGVAKYLEEKLNVW